MVADAPIENIRKIAAPVVVESQIQSQPVFPVEGADGIVPAPVADGQQIVFPARCQRREGAADDVQVGDAEDFVPGDGGAGDGIHQLPFADPFHQVLGSGGIALLGIHRGEKDIVRIGFAQVIHPVQHARQGKHGHRAGGVAVRPGIQPSRQAADAVVVRQDNHVFVRLSRKKAQKVPAPFFTDAETVGPNAVQGLQAEGFEVTGNPRTCLEMAPPAQSASAFQGIGQKGNFPLQDGFLYHKFPIHGADGVTLPLGCRRDGQTTGQQKKYENFCRFHFAGTINVRIFVRFKAQI